MLNLPKAYYILTYFLMFLYLENVPTNQTKNTLAKMNHNNNFRLYVWHENLLLFGFQSLIEYSIINRSDLRVLEIKRNDGKAFVKQ